MKKIQFYLVSSTLMLSLVGCVNNHQAKEIDSIYGDKSTCNGDYEVTHAVVLGDSEQPDTPKPEVSATCTPSIYPAETEFEKANRTQLGKKH